jgi:hypothetical protein
MRQLLEERQGQKLYVFTTLGNVYVGVMETIIEDVVQLRAPDGVTPVFVNLADVSGLRVYDQDNDEARP